MPDGLIEIENCIIETLDQLNESAGERRGYLRGLGAAEEIISNAHYLGKGAREPLLDAIRALKTAPQEG